MRSTNIVVALLQLAAIAASLHTSRPALAASPGAPSSENRFAVSIVIADRATGEGPVLRAVRVGNRGTAYRFRVHTAADQSLSTADVWEVTVYAASAANGFGQYRSLARLSSSRPEVLLPRPYGYALAESDSLVVVAEVSDGNGASEDLTVTVDLEAGEAGMGRWGLLSQAANGVSSSARPAGGETGGGVRSWEWTANASGKVQIITGSHLSEADELVLYDMETGQVVRRGGRAGRAQSDGVQDAGFVRMPATVQEGRRYRLTAVYSDRRHEAWLNADSLVHALVLPPAEASVAR